MALSRVVTPQALNNTLTHTETHSHNSHPAVSMSNSPANRYECVSFDPFYNFSFLLFSLSVSFRFPPPLPLPLLLFVPAFLASLPTNSSHPNLSMLLPPSLIVGTLKPLFRGPDPVH